MTATEFMENSKDELSTPGASFNHMRRSLHKAKRVIEENNSPRRIK
jgi:hypothetical protein